ncbi:hypothetical protein BDA96_03G031400 [Sorghum bicolor]|uniref:Uncharacterized protein n=2 Tax=Sorghum bicolor TaxID=4558 RepID=A0A921R8Y4_SORBI|nr:hypothetical protein SORBI_3003G028700 [Sorghum bicolor]KAG0536054.1 hypothetical protein BDA96_03G031400 [Sorghum bicolor]
MAGGSGQQVRTARSGRDSRRRTSIEEQPSGDAGAAPRKVQKAERRCRGGYAAGATGQRTKAEEQPSRARCLPAPLLSSSLLARPLLSSSPSPALTVKASSGRFWARRAV